MLSLIEKINQDLRQAMRDRQETTVSVLRMLISAVRSREITLRKGAAVNLNDEQIIEVIMSEVKKRKDSASAYKGGSRPDLAAKEENEIKILEKYLPPAMDDKELEKIIKEVVDAMEDAGMNNFGEIMSRVMPLIKGRADGGKVSAAVKKVL